MRSERRKKILILIPEIRRSTIYTCQICLVININSHFRGNNNKGALEGPNERTNERTERSLRTLSPIRPERTRRVTDEINGEAANVK